jgi:hypothetical protein
MSRSLLDRIPNEILQQIAFLLVLSPGTPFGSLHDLFAFLLTCSRVHHRLNVDNCPHLYARLFRCIFDFDFDLHCHLDDALLASELMQRQRILHLASAGKLAGGLTVSDTWLVFRMAIENIGRNEMILNSSGLLSFIRGSIENRLISASLVPALSSTDHLEEADVVGMWAYCLTLTHGKSVPRSRCPVRVILRHDMIQIMLRRFHAFLESVCGRPFK